MLQLHVDNACQVRLIWSDNPPGVTAMNVLAGTYTGTPAINQAFAETIGAAIKSALTSSGLAAHLHSSVYLMAVGVRDIRTVANAEYFDTGAAVVGTGTGDPLPRSNACCITLRTAKAGRSYRGRVYIGGFTETENDASGNINATTAGLAAAFVNAIKTAMNTNSIPMGVLSRNREQKTLTVVTTHSDGSTSTKTRLQSSSAGFITPVTAVQLRNTTWDSQRRRTAPGSASTFRALYSYTDEGFSQTEIPQLKAVRGR